MKWGEAVSKIIKVTTSGDYWITVKFDNNHSVRLDMKKRLHTARFSELRDIQVFNAAQTEGKSVQWPGGISLAISEMMEMIVKKE